MNPKEWENPEEWASQTFASAELGDPRRTDRLVQIAAALAEEPAASLPNAMRNVSETMAAYRFLNTPEMSHEQIMQPHWAQTRQMAAERAWVLLIADQTAHHAHEPYEHERSWTRWEGRSRTGVPHPHGAGGRCREQADPGLCPSRPLCPAKRASPRNAGTASSAPPRVASLGTQRAAHRLPTQWQPLGTRGGERSRPLHVLGSVPKAGM